MSVNDEILTGFGRWSKSPISEVGNLLCCRQSAKLAAKELKFYIINIRGTPAHGLLVEGFKPGTFRSNVLHATSYTIGKEFLTLHFQVYQKQFQTE